MKNTLTYGLTHVAVSVADPDKTLRFYQHLFDMEVMYREEDMIQLTTPGCHDILVFEKKNQEETGKSGGIAHFGFRLREAADIDQIHQRLMEAGGTLLEKGEFVPGSPYLFFKDPDGYIIEVWYEWIPADQ